MALSLRSVSASLSLYLFVHSLNAILQPCISMLFISLIWPNRFDRVAFQKDRSSTLPIYSFLSQLVDYCSCLLFDSILVLFKARLTYASNYLSMKLLSWEFILLYHLSPWGSWPIQKWRFFPSRKSRWIFFRDYWNRSFFGFYPARNFGSKSLSLSRSWILDFSINSSLDWECQ